ncbi:MAG: ankyrin repeat domain-containing protein [Acidobacteriota bacterium]
MHFVRQSVVVVVAVAGAACTLVFDQPGTPLARAAQAGDVAAIRTLVAQGADPNAFDASGQTALHWAARGGHPVGPHRCRGEHAEWPKVIAALVDLGASVDAVDRRRAVPGGSSGWTPLHVALHHEQFAVAALLLERGANPNIRSGQGRSVLEVASSEGAPRELLQALLDRGYDARLARRP